MSISRKVLALAVVSAAACVLIACGGAASRAARYVERGQDYLAKGNLEKARVEFRNALQISPNNINLRLQNGLVEEKLGGYQRAAQYFQSVVELDKGNAEARAHMAKLLLFSGAPQRAITYAQPGLDAHPDSVALLTVRAAARAQLKDPAGAMADATRALQLAPDDETAVSTLAGLYKSSGHALEALSLIKAAVARSSRSIELREVLVQYYAGEGQRAPAEVVLKELIQLEPQEAAHRINLARFYASGNQLDDAERVLRGALQAAPANAELRQALVAFLSERRGLPVAQRELAALVNVNPRDYDLQLALGTAYEQGKQTAQAESLYRRIVAAEGTNAAALTARNRLAAMATQRNDVSSARQLLAEVLGANPHDNEALIIRSGIALSQGNAHDAIVDLRAVVRDQPNSVPLLRQLARAYFANGDEQLGEDMLRQAMDGNAGDNTARVDLAQYYLQTQRVDQARTLTRELVKRDPQDADFEQLEFRAAAAQVDYPAAAAAATALREQHPELPMGWYMSGLVAEAQGHADVALNNYDKALTINGRAQEPLDALIKLLLSRQRTDAALARLTRIIALYPDDGYAINRRGEVLLGMQRWSEANTAFLAAARVAPQWWVPFRNQAYVRLGLGDQDGAVKVLHDASKRLDQSEPLVGELATILQKLHRNDEAIEAYEALLRKNPRSEFAANNLAMLLVSVRNDGASLDRARDLAGRFAAAQNPNYLDTSGWVLFRHGEATAAVPLLEKAVSLAPEVPVIRYHLAMAQHSAGQTESARNNLERAVRGNPAFDGLDEARAKLAEWHKSG
jgi:tetratricopeptide (TPR) repeat protein